MEMMNINIDYKTLTIKMSLYPWLSEILHPLGIGKLLFTHTSDNC